MVIEITLFIGRMAYHFSGAEPPTPRTYEGIRSIIPILAQIGAVVWVLYFGVYRNTALMARLFWLFSLLPFGYLSILLCAQDSLWFCSGLSSGIAAIFHFWLFLKFQSEPFDIFEFYQRIRPELNSTERS
jgi:hypothetical protein